MAHPGPDEWPASADLDCRADLVVDPDAEEAPFPDRNRSRWPRIDPRLVAGVAVGGFAGGLARYEVGLAWPTPPGAFPWAIFVVNTAGAFILAALLVAALELLPPTKYLRAVAGTGFCGAFTTFSSVVTSAYQLSTAGHAGLAASYLAGSVAAGSVAALSGLSLVRSLAAGRRQEGPA